MEYLDRQAPVNYIKDENGIISGFNKDGNLVCLYNPYGKYVAIEYDSSDRISGIYDSDDKTMAFEYANGLLQSITDNHGRKVQYSYSFKKLSSVRFADGSSIKIAYKNNYLSTVTSGNEIKATVTTSGNKLTAISTTSSNITISDKITNNDILIPSTKTLSSMAVKYENNLTKLTFKDGLEETYIFYDSLRLKKHQKNDGRGRISFVHYSHVSDGNGKTVTVISGDNLSCHYDRITETYNDFDLLVLKQSNEATVSDNLKVSTKNEYEYDVNNKLVQEKTTAVFTGGTKPEEHISFVKYYYNAQGLLTFTESYVEGEELKTGKKIEERVYDENGNVIKTISWNTLDSSAKFYSESEYSENGQVTADKNEYGENSAEYEYLDGTNVVNSVKYANGSKIAYGRNIFNNQVTSVTQSTDNGEGNTTDIIYNYGLPIEVKSGNTVIDYKYDYTRRKSLVSINGMKYADYTYTDYSYDSANGKYNLEGITEKLYNGNGNFTFSCQRTGVKDSTYENGIAEAETLKVNNIVLLEKSCSANKLLTNAKVKDLSGAVTYKTDCTYDKYDNLKSAITSKGSEVISDTEYEYDDYGALCGKVVSVGDCTHSYSYKYNDGLDRSLKYVGFGAYKFYPLTDYYGRNKGKEIFSGTNKIAGEYISYRKVGDHATNMPSAVWYGNGTAIKDSIKYTYDKCGNICEIKENGAFSVRYEYDALNRLVREDNKKFGKTYLFEYDGNGNIVSKRKTAFTRRRDIEECDFEKFEYSFNGDRLVSFNGESCEYNKLGCPTVYRGKTATWKYGKILASLNGTAFTYDVQGRRLSKGNVEFIYDNDGNLIKQSNGLEFIYDAGGAVGFKYNNVQYFYRKDVQGNIIAILDSTGNIVVEYNYDAWGKCEVKGNLTLGELNPFRYRGYYYDTETGLYYLQTRYYDPEVGRFISQDSIEFVDPEHINGLNLYAYCGDNPIMSTDPTGTTEWWEWLVGIVIIVAAVVLSIFTAGLAAPLAAAIGGGLLGAVLAGAAVGAISGAIAGFGISVGVQAITNGFDNINWDQVNSDTKAGSFSGMISGGIFGGFNYAISASGVVSSLSGLSSAQNNFEHAQFILQNTPIKITGGVIATERITAQLNYNVASVALGTAQSSYNIINNIVNVLSALAKFGFKLITNNLIKGK